MVGSHYLIGLNKEYGSYNFIGFQKTLNLQFFSGFHMMDRSHIVPGPGLNNSQFMFGFHLSIGSQFITGLHQKVFIIYSRFAKCHWVSLD